jgi:hypothetical protein
MPVSNQETGFLFAKKVIHSFALDIILLVYTIHLSSLVYKLH